MKAQYPYRFSPTTIDKRMKGFLLVSVAVLLPIGSGFAQTKEKKPKVIVMTDGEVDDHSSMIRMLLYTCDMDVKAIIETNSIFQRVGHSNEDWYEKQLAAYEAVYPNLIRHRPDYPTAAYLRSVSYVGDEDYEHLKGLDLSLIKPGDSIRYTPENWADTPGSDKIVSILLEEDPDPVFIQVWGGGNTAARAFYKLKTEHPDDYERAISKVTMYNIWYQDGAGNYIEKNHPLVTLIYCDSFSGTWDYRSLNDSYGFITTHIKNDHGPLGALYPQDYVSEGDTPAFLYTLANGLENHLDPNNGGWGGRFVKLEGLPNVYIDAVEDGDQRKSLRRWVDDANNDFQNRMDWCVADDFKKANHAPVPVIKGGTRFTVKSGEYLTLDGRESTDPDGTWPKGTWELYKGASSYKGHVRMLHGWTRLMSFKAPKVEKPETLHFIYTLTDYAAKPIIKSYQRVIVTVNP